MILKILCMKWGHCGSAQVLLILHKEEYKILWNIIIARFRGKKTIQGNENINLFPGKRLLYYTCLEWSKWGESDVKGNVLVLQRVPFQNFIAYFNDCICWPKMNMVCLTSKSWCENLFLFARHDYAKESWWWVFFLVPHFLWQSCNPRARVIDLWYWRYHFCMYLILLSCQCKPTLLLSHSVQMQGHYWFRCFTNKNTCELLQRQTSLSE